MKIKNPFVIPGLIVTVVAIAGLATGCGLEKAVEPYQDAPRAGAENMAGATVIAMPDGFSNLATKCVGDIRYTVAFHNNNPYGAVSTVVDPQCGK